MSNLIARLVASVMKHEGSYDSINRNTDGAGLSVGIFQWPQRTGGLAQVLQAYYKTDPVMFRQIFGPNAAGLLKHAESRSLGPLDGALLWEEPWASRFVKAGRHAPYQVAQDRLARESVFIRSAFQGAFALGSVTERALTVILDAAVSQGPEYAVSVAKRVQKKYAGQTVPQRTLLEAYLAYSSAHFRSEMEPPPSRVTGMSWRKVGDEWHKFAGQIDLYRNIQKRRGAFITSTELTDHTLTITPELYTV